MAFSSETSSFLGVLHIRLYLEEELLHKGILPGDAPCISSHFCHLSYGTYDGHSTSMMHVVRWTKFDSRPLFHGPLLISWFISSSIVLIVDGCFFYSKSQYLK